MLSTFSAIAVTEGMAVWDTKAEFKEYTIFAESWKEANIAAKKRACSLGMDCCVLELDRLVGETRESAEKWLAA